MKYGCTYVFAYSILEGKESSWKIGRVSEKTSVNIVIDEKIFSAPSSSTLVSLSSLISATYSFTSLITESIIMIVDTKSTGIRIKKITIISASGGIPTGS
jgi:hypothetical protein